MNEVSEQTGGVEAAEYPLATRRWRFVAAMLDGVLGLIVSLPVFFYFDIWSTLYAEEPLELHVLAITFAWSVLTFLAINYWLLEHRGQTVGKWCVDIAIVGIDGERKSAVRILIRRYLPVWLVAQLPFIGQFLALIDVLFIFGKGRRCVHDYIAGTKVIDADPRTESAADAITSGR